MPRAHDPGAIGRCCFEPATCAAYPTYPGWLPVPSSAGTDRDLCLKTRGYRRTWYSWSNSMERCVFPPTSPAHSRSGLAVRWRRRRFASWGASLDSALLRDVRLTGTNLTSTTLRGAVLTGTTDLRSADLSAVAAAALLRDWVIEVRQQLGQIPR